MKGINKQRESERTNERKKEGKKERRKERKEGRKEQNVTMSRLGCGPSLCRHTSPLLDECADTCCRVLVFAGHDGERLDAVAPFRIKPILNDMKQHSDPQWESNNEDLSQLIGVASFYAVHQHTQHAVVDSTQRKPTHINSNKKRTGADFGTIRKHLDNPYTAKYTGKWLLYNIYSNPTIKSSNYWVRA